MPDHSNLELVDDTSWNTVRVVQERVDPGIRLVASLMDLGDTAQLFRRTGILVDGEGNMKDPRMPLLIELGHGNRMHILSALADAEVQADGFSLSFNPAYLEEAGRNRGMSVIAARLAWSTARVVRLSESGSGLRRAIGRLLERPDVVRVALPNALHATLQESHRDIVMPAGRLRHGQTATGNGVIVGVIDDGCALAHPHFLHPGTLQSRILNLWEQDGPAPVAGVTAYWTQPAGLPGRELTQPNIDAVLAACTVGNRIDEDAVYRILDYDLEADAHGTHVLDIAAGNGGSLMGHEGIANEADIIFVQLPRAQVNQGGAALESHILDGVQYIFQRAAQLNRQAVVNISFGGYCGPHDGTSLLSTGIDAMLHNQRGRAVVVSAGNGFEADCHATGQLPRNANTQPPLAWILRPENPTSSQLEIWYDAAARLQMSLWVPGSPAPLPPVGLNQWRIIREVGTNRVLGWIQHMPSGGSNVIRINLNATAGAMPAGGAPGMQQQLPVPGFAAQAAPALTGSVPCGAWLVNLRNSGNVAATFHAFIERDDMRKPGAQRGQRSRFHETNADPFSTVADIGTGRLVICVGGHNTLTGEMCRYSACGPTRDGRPKPDFTAPSEETGRGGGVLSASSRSARPSRMRGTSAAAPHVTGMVALIMQTSPAPLTSTQIRASLVNGAVIAAGRPYPPWRVLRPNTRQSVDPHRPPPKRQAARFASVIGAGKVNMTDTP